MVHYAVSRHCFKDITFIGPYGEKNVMQICEMTAEHICLQFCKGPEVQIYTVTPTVAEREPRNVSVICNAICAICKFFDCTKA